MKYLSCETKDQCLRVTLCRPEKRNAFHPGLISELTDVFKNQVHQEDLGSVLLTGKGESFSAGADLDYMKSMIHCSFEDNKKDATLLFEMFDTISKCPLPTIAKAHGHVMGGGLGLLAACDLVACENNTHLSFSEIHLGLVASVIGPFVFRKLKSSHLRKWMLTGKSFSAHEALESQLVHFIGNTEEVCLYVEGHIQNWKNVSKTAVRETKKLILELEKNPNPESLKNLCTELISERRISPEAQKFIESFLNKRS